MEDWLCWPRLVAAWAVSPEVGGWGGGGGSGRPTTHTCVGHARGHRLAPSSFPAWDPDPSGGNSLPPTSQRVLDRRRESQDKSNGDTCCVTPPCTPFLELKRLVTPPGCCG